MGREIRADYAQRMLLPPSLEDWVPRDHPARFVRAFVDELDLGELGFALPETDVGRPGYAADLLLKVWIYGYLNKIRSSRQLERACREHISLLWLTGMHEPDHNTLWRFWRDNRRGIRRLFGETVRIGYRCGLVGLNLHAADGTKIQTRGSKKSCWTDEQMSEWLDRLTDEIEEEIEEAEQCEDGSYRLPEEMQDREALRRRIEEARRQLAEAGKKQLHPREPEAQQMRCTSGPELAYNAQIVVDEQSRLIVAEDVVTDGSDNHQLVGLLEQVATHLPRAAGCTVADGGYFSGPTVEAAQSKNLGILVNLPTKLRGDDPNPYATSHFHFDPEEQSCRCPRGVPMKPDGTSQRTDVVKPYGVARFRCTAFHDCPVRWDCSQNKTGRRVEFSTFYEAVKRHQARAISPEGEALLRRRRAIVEAPFGTIKESSGFRRFTSWGLEAAQTQWAMTCSVFNLQKLYRLWWKAQQAPA